MDDRMVETIKYWRGSTVKLSTLLREDYGISTKRAWELIADFHEEDEQHERT